MNNFPQLLENGDYRSHREVTWYADKLCVTSKHHSDVSKSVSGFTANFWINRYTTLDISRLLRDKSLSFVQIFRYVQLLVACLLQPLRAQKPRRQPNRLQRLRPHKALKWLETNDRVVHLLLPQMHKHVNRVIFNFAFDRQICI